MKAARGGSENSTCISDCVVQGARAMSSLVAANVVWDDNNWADWAAELGGGEGGGGEGVPGLWMSTHLAVLLSTKSPLMTFFMVATPEKKRAN